MSRNHNSLNKRRWEATRRAVFLRDNYTCTMCHKRGRLEAHHLISMNDNPDQDPYDPAGATSHCRSCHILEHQKENEVPGQRDWLTFLAELSAKNQA